MTTDDRGEPPMADKDALQRAVDEQTAAAEAAAGSEPIVNAEPPAKKAAAKKTAAKKTAAKKAPAAKKASPAKKAATAKKAPTAKKAAAKKAPAKRTTAAPVVAPAPVAEPGDPTGAPVQPPAPSAAEETGHSAPSPEAREVSGDDLRAVVEGWSYDPHGVLGTHFTSAGWVVRTLRPDAVSVAVLDEDGARYEARQLHGGGIYEAQLPQQPGDYRIEVAYQGGAESYTVDDPYRWMPTLGELDQHLIREGRHERLWDVLGAHVRRYETPRGTVEGVSFAVWAPNARGVKVTGDFDYWEARAYPMRSLGWSGIWEIFIPGVQV